MPRLIQFTDTSDQAVFINADHVVSVNQVNNTTMIVTTAGTYQVKEDLVTVAHFVRHTHA